jgi:hypothetical protein
MLEKLTMRPVCVEADPGAMETVMFGAAVTVTAAVALLDWSATLVATTWKVPAVPGAVYLPEPSTCRRSRLPRRTSSRPWTDRCRLRSPSR